MSHHPWTRRRLAGIAGAVLAVGLLAGPLSTTASASVTPPSQGAPPTCPADEGLPRAIRYVYLSVLYRCPEPGAIDYWTGRIDAGMSGIRFAQLVILSAESTNQQSADAYALLPDPPSIAALQAGAASIRLHQSNIPLAASIYASDEYYATLGGPDADQLWLEEVYTRFLERVPDPAGRAYFTGLLGTPSTATTRLRVARIIGLGYESNNAFLVGAYPNILGRPIDAAGQEYWNEFLDKVQPDAIFKVEAFLFGSAEGYQFAQTQPT